MNVPFDALSLWLCPRHRGTSQDREDDSNRRAFPTVQPHHRTHHYPTHDGSQPMYDVNVNLPFRNDPSKSFLNPISRSRLQLPHPVQRLDSRDASGSSSTANGGEHALRRKTPNGTLAAGYDGTPGDTTIQPASKHILVSPMESGQFLSQAGMQLENWQPMLDQSATKHMNFPPVFKNDGNAMPGEVIQDANGTSWVNSVNYPPGVDSVLNQSLLYLEINRTFTERGICAHSPPSNSTVMPGTDRFGRQWSLGPYWPDGVYIPYRPAAFRDARYESPTPFAKQLSPTGQPFYDLNQPVFNQPQVPLGSSADPGLA